MSVAAGIALGLIGIFLISCLIFFYFLPSYIASVRKHKHFKSILLVNILTGWTFLGWAAGLIWSFTDDRITIS
jgi:hypothetical protein